MKELMEAIEKILIMAIKQKIQNYVISGCLMILFKAIAIILIFLIMFFTAVWGVNTFIRNVNNPNGIVKTKTEQIFKNALEKPKANEIKTEENMKQEAQHKENEEEKERRIEEEIKARETPKKEIKCIGDGCGKPKGGKITIKESE